MSSTATTAGVRTTVGRLPGLGIAVGGATFLAGLSAPVIQEVFDNFRDPTVVRAAIEADPTAWDVSAAVTGLAAVIVSLGLLLLGRRIIELVDRESVRKVGTAVAWFGLGQGAWVLIAFYRVVASPETLSEDLNGWPVYNVIAMVVWSAGVLGSFIATGLAHIRMKCMPAVGWLVLVVGTLLGLVAVVLPAAAYIGYVFAGALFAVFPLRGAGESTRA